MPRDKPLNKVPKKEDKLIIKQFKNSKNDWWLAMKHWTIIEGKPFLAAGGMFVQEEYDHIYKYLKGKKLI